MIIDLCDDCIDALKRAVLSVPEEREKADELERLRGDCGELRAYVSGLRQECAGLREICAILREDLRIERERNKRAQA